MWAEAARVRDGASVRNHSRAGRLLLGEDVDTGAALAVAVSNHYHGAREDEMTCWCGRELLHCHAGDILDVGVKLRQSSAVVVTFHSHGLRSLLLDEGVA